MGEALGRDLDARSAALAAPGQSLLLGAWQNGTPVTVHVAIGTDTPHTHPAADPAAIGAATHHDFRLFSALVAGAQRWRRLPECRARPCCCRRSS